MARAVSPALLFLGVLVLSVRPPDNAQADDDPIAESGAAAPDRASMDAARAEVAADAMEESREPARRFDYSRFRDGPRNVPRPRGASATRAERLGLGTRAAASRLLHRRPHARWVDAAVQAGEMPEHLHWPVALGRFGRGFGYVRRRRPDLPHRGVDIVADEGSTIRAVAPGIVAYSDNGVRGLGNLVLIVHPNGATSLYAHCVRTTVQPGWRVRAGERIGFVGNTGISRGPHLHFEYHVAGRAVNPLPHFDGRPWIAAYREWTRQRRAGTYQSPTEYLAARLSADGAAPPRAPQPTVHGDDQDGLAEARRLLGEGANAGDLELVEGDRFSNALWPVRGGHRESDYVQPRGVNIHAEEGTPVRAIADGRVVYAGQGLRGVGQAVVLLHRSGWVSLYGSNASLHVEAGQQVRRGEWIARVGTSGGGAPHLHFQLKEGGQSLSPSAFFVGEPD